jgi:hypothetical protein
MQVYYNDDRKDLPEEEKDGRPGRWHAGCSETWDKVALAHYVLFPGDEMFDKDKAWNQGWRAGIHTRIASHVDVGAILGCYGFWSC